MFIIRIIYKPSSPENTLANDNTKSREMAMEIAGFAGAGPLIDYTGSRTQGHPRMKLMQQSMMDAYLEKVTTYVSE